MHAISLRAHAWDDTTFFSGGRPRSPTISAAFIQTIIRTARSNSLLVGLFRFKQAAREEAAAAEVKLVEERHLFALPAAPLPWRAERRRSGQHRPPPFPDRNQ